LSVINASASTQVQPPYLVLMNSTVSAVLDYRGTS